MTNKERIPEQGGDDELATMEEPVWEFPTLDGESTWTGTHDMEYLERCGEALKSLRQALNGLHRHEGKAFTCGLTSGIEAYLRTVEKGRLKT